MGDRKGWITDELGFMLNKPPCEPLPSDAVDEILASYAKTVLRVRGGFKDVQEAKAKLDAHYAGLYEPLIKELVAEARIDGAIMGAKFGNAALRQYNVAGKPMNLDEIRDAGIKQAEDWAKRQC